MEIIAHRGASSEAPENTLAAVRLAWDLDADAVEVDVHLTSDRCIVVSHDDNTARTAGRRMVIRDHALADLRELDVGSCKGDRFAGERIPTLDEVLELTPKGKRVFIEVKCGPEIIPELVLALERAEAGVDEAVIISFDLGVINASKYHLPDVPAYWLCSFRDAGTDALLDGGQRADGLDIAASPLLDARFVMACNGLGLSVYAWGVDSIREAERLESIGIAGITTDCLREMVRRFRR